MAVIRPSIETDPAELETIAFDYLRSAEPGWEPAEGDGLTMTVRAHARIIAEERDVADDVALEQILRPLGEKVHRIIALTASAATASATVTARDTAGYTIPAGLEVLVKTAGDDGVTMLVSEPATIAPGSSTTGIGEVTLRAAPGREGVVGNGLTSANEAVSIRSFDFIDSIDLVGTSSGGVDAETDDAYLERMTAELALTSPIPTLAPDFAALARRVPAVARALAINLYTQVSDVISVTYSGSGTGTLTDPASARSVSLTSGLTASSLAAAFVALTPASGARYAATATGGPLNTAPIVVTLRARTAYGPWQVASTGPTVSVSETQRGGETTLTPRAVAVAVVDADGEPLSSGVKAEVEALLEGMREANWIVSVIDPTYTAIDVTFTLVTWPGQDPAAVRAAAITAVQSYLSPANWGTGPFGEEPGWTDEPVVRFQELSTLLNNVPGVKYWSELRIGLEGRTLGTSDITMTGTPALPRPGAGITGTATEG